MKVKKDVKNNQDVIASQSNFRMSRSRQPWLALSHPFKKIGEVLLCFSLLALSCYLEALD